MDISYWRELNDGFTDFLVEKGYTHDITRHYRGTINLLIRFANANGYKAYTQEIGEKFLEFEERLMYLQQAGYQRQRLVIRRFNKYLDDGKYSYTYLRVNYECPEAFKEVLEHYLKSLETANLKQCTIDKHRVFTIKLCRDFAKNGIESWDAVDAKALSGAFDRATSKAQFAACIRKLFGFLVKEGIVKYNYAELPQNIFVNLESSLTTGTIAHMPSGCHSQAASQRKMCLIKRLFPGGSRPLRANQSLRGIMQATCAGLLDT